MLWDSDHTKRMVSGRLRALLKKKGFTIAAAAECAGMTKQQVWKIVTGKIPNPGYCTVYQIVEAVGGTMKELHEDDED
jgi:transcriptional regulator with XRE-family HTH domain